MIKYKLICKNCDIKFDSWFGSSEEYDKLKNNEVVKENLMKSAAWFLGFLSRNTSWISGYDHNQLRITRVIESLRLLVSDEAANEFFQSILSLVKDPSLINPATIKFWEEA